MGNMSKSGQKWTKVGNSGQKWAFYLYLDHVPPQQNRLQMHDRWICETRNPWVFRRGPVSFEVLLIRQHIVERLFHFDPEIRYVFSFLYYFYISTVFKEFMDLESKFWYLLVSWDQIIKQRISNLRIFFNE